jgi:hypothetical protein
LTTAKRVIPTLALVVSGCVAGADRPSPTDPHRVTTTTSAAVLTTATTVPVEAGAVAFQDCLGEEGVVIERVRLDARGRPRLAESLSGLDLADRSVLDALESCGHHLAGGALDLTSDPELRNLVQKALGELASCLRSWGVEEFPDPVPGFDGVGSPFSASRIPWDDPDLSDAVAVCRDLPLGSG